MSLNPFHQSSPIINALKAEIATLRKHQVRSLQDIAELKAESLLRAAGRSARLPLGFHAQYGEDALVWNMLGRPLNGFFIEVGAFDGVSFSVTYALESIGWDGLLIEALPEKAQACRAARPNSRVVHSALGPPNSGHTAVFSSVSDHHGGMFSYLTTDAQHQALIDRLKIETQKVEVPLTTMDILLADQPHAEIDLAVVDVEGGEVDLLKGFDLQLHRPKVLLVEDNTLNKNPALDQHMATQPYKMAGFIEVSRLYIRADLTDVLAKASGS